MATFVSMIPNKYLELGPIEVEPGRDISFGVDHTGAFSARGPLATEGSEEAAIAAFDLNDKFGVANCLAVIDAHVPGSAHSELAYTPEAEIVPNVTTLTEERVLGWMKIGEDRILRPGAMFSLGQLITSGRLTRWFTGRDQIVWAEHAGMGSWETNFINPLIPGQHCNIFYKGTHPLHDSHSGVWDAVGNPVGTIQTIAARPLHVRNIFVHGNAFGVCIYLTLRHLSRVAAMTPGMTIYCVVDATGFLPFIDQQARLTLINELVELGVKFVTKDQMKFN
jgi:hypothetical protein